MRSKPGRTRPAAVLAVRSPRQRTLEGIPSTYYQFHTNHHTESTASDRVSLGSGSIDAVAPTFRPVSSSVNRVRSPVAFTVDRREAQGYCLLSIKRPVSLQGPGRQPSRNANRRVSRRGAEAPTDVGTDAAERAICLWREPCAGGAIRQMTGVLPATHVENGPLLVP